METKRGGAQELCQAAGSLCLFSCTFCTHLRCPATTTAPARGQEEQPGLKGKHVQQKKQGTESIFCAFLSQKAEGQRSKHASQMRSVTSRVGPCRGWEPHLLWQLGFEAIPAAVAAAWLKAPCRTFNKPYQLINAQFANAQARGILQQRSCRVLCSVFVPKTPENILKETALL